MGAASGHDVYGGKATRPLVATSKSATKKQKMQHSTEFDNLCISLLDNCIVSKHRENAIEVNKYMKLYNTNTIYAAKK